MEAMNDNLPARLWRKVYPRLEPIMLAIAMTVPGVVMRTEFPFMQKSARDALAEDARAVRSDVLGSVRKCLDEAKGG